MATITWAVKPDGLHTTTKNGNTDFIVRVECVVSATDGVNSFSFPYECEFDVAGDTFTPFQSLSEAQVLDWVKQKLGPAQLENMRLGIENHLLFLASPPPPVVQKSAPWSA